MLKKWAEKLKKIPDSFFYADKETEKDIQDLRELFTHLAEMEDLSGFGEKISISIIRSHLKQQMQQEAYGLGFITGGVTFCAMLPMRSIPFPVICLIGINSGSYPRRTQTYGFDLMAQKPERGDRSPAEPRRGARPK